MCAWRRAGGSNPDYAQGVLPAVDQPTTAGTRSRASGLAQQDAKGEMEPERIARGMERGSRRKQRGRGGEREDRKERAGSERGDGDRTHSKGNRTGEADASKGGEKEARQE